MSSSTQKHRNAAGKSRGAARKPHSGTAARKPAYLRRKMAVSTPGDQQEREADRVAGEVSRSPRVSRAQDAGAAPEEQAQGVVPAARSLQRQSMGEAAETPTPEEETAQTKLQREAAVPEEEEKAVQARLYRRTLNRQLPAAQDEQNAKEEALQTRLYRQAETPEEKDALQTQLFRQAAMSEEPVQARLYRLAEEEEAAQPRLRRQEKPTEEDEKTAAAKGDPVAGQALDEETEQKIDALRGTGDPLPEDVREDMETRFGKSFANVGIHTGPEAEALSRQLNARAFTVGNDIFFAPGEFVPNTDQGRNLLAHELAHVVQQGGRASRIHRRIEPEPSPPHAPNSPSQRKLDALSQLELPPTKQRHRALYASMASSGNLKRVRGYSRGRPAQVRVWRSGVIVDEAVLAAKIAPVKLPTTPGGEFAFKIRDKEVKGTKAEVLQRLQIPDWDRRGRDGVNYQVDHIVELQVSGEHGTGVGNSLENMELLDQPSNASSGAVIMSGIYSRVREYLATLDPVPNQRTWLRNHDIIFDGVTVGGRGSAEGDSSWWSKTDIEQAEPAARAQPVPDRPLEGHPDWFVLASGPGGIEIGRFSHLPSELSFSPGNRVQARRVAGLVIEQITLTQEAESASAGANIGSITASWDLPDKFQAEGQPVIPIIALGPHVGYLGEVPALSGNFEPLSPVSFAQVSVRSNELYAEGSIIPSVPLLSNTTITAALTGNDVVFRVDYAPGDLNLEFPGLSIDDALLSLSYSRRNGFGVSGMVMFGVDNLGDGSITAAVSQGGGFEASGQFNFDSSLFDRATVNVWYRNNAFGGSGEIGIDTEDKIRGIRSANLSVTLEEEAFRAEGSVQPKIPGVEEAGLTVAYSEDEGLTIGGSLNLSSDVPGIESGSVEVEVNKRDGEWKVSASGTAVPSIPGIDSELSASYDDGAFTAEFRGNYARGMLSGELTAGVTNRTVDENGQPTGDPAPDAPLIVYGGGSVTIQIAPWLQGTAGIRFDPNGEVTVSGEIALPNQVEIFPRQEINKSIFQVAVQAPIVPGIVAEIGGGLSATAGIGPGVIDELRLGVEYNPAHEENTTVTGDAHLNIPANAGLRLSARAGIGLGITGASATGGLEVGGTLGIEGAAEAGVHIDWSPAAGLNLHADLGVHAQPSFTFDISGYVAVTALGISVYDNRWELASFSYGSDMRFGINMPIDYREGEPFNISLDDVEFEVPDIDVNSLVRGLISRIA